MFTMYEVHFPKSGVGRFFVKGNRVWVVDQSVCKIVGECSWEKYLIPTTEELLNCVKNIGEMGAQENEDMQWTHGISYEGKTF